MKYVEEENREPRVADLVSEPVDCIIFNAAVDNKGTIRIMDRTVSPFYQARFSKKQGGKVMEMIWWRNSDSGPARIETQQGSENNGNTRRTITPYLIAAFCLVMFMILTVMNAHSEIYRWVDQQGVIHFRNLEPQWWQKEKTKLVFSDKRTVDKPETLKKNGLPLDTPDYNKEDIVGMNSNPVGKAIGFNSSKRPGLSSTEQLQKRAMESSEDKAMDESEEKGYEEEGYQPQSIDDIKNMKPGSVLADTEFKQFHNPGCERITVGLSNRPQYKMDLDHSRIFSSPREARKAGYVPCPICGGKPH